MKVLLMVQVGVAPPKCASGVHGDVKARATGRAHDELCPGWMFTWDQSVAMYGADRWWLVEAESAEAARAVIEVCRDYPLRETSESARSFAAQFVSGRILASGGRK